MFVVAAKLGMTVRELGARMDASELVEWLAYLKIEATPGPPKTDDELIAEALARKARTGLDAQKRQQGR